MSPALRPEVLAQLAPGAFMSRTALRIDRSNLVGLLSISNQLDASAPLLDRTQVTVPVCPTPAMTESTVLEHATDPGVHYVVQTQRIRRNTVRFSSWSTGFKLTAVVAPASAPPAGTTAADVVLVAELHYDLSPVLHQTLAFTDYELEEGGTRVTYRSTDPQERADVHWAITDPESKAELVVRRTVPVALPVLVQVQVPGATVWANSAVGPQMARMQMQMPTGTPMAMMMDDAPGRDPIPRTVPKPKPHVPQPIPPPVPQPVPPPPPPAEPSPIPPRIEYVTLYRVSTATLEQPGQPMRFSTAVDVEVFPDLGRPEVSFVRRDVDGQVYLQKSVGSPTFYSLPESLRLVRRPETPHTPIMTMSFADPAGHGGPDPEVQVHLRFAVLPWIAPDRLAAARERLAKFAPPPYPAGVDGVQIVPLTPVSSDLGLTLRVADGSPAALPLVAPEISLTKIFDCEITLPVSDFRPAWTALAAGSGALLAGSLEVELNDDEAAGLRVPFQGRFDTAYSAVPLLDVTRFEALPDGTVSATLRNGIESGLRIRSLRVNLDDGSGQLPATVTQPDLSAGVTLAAGAILDVVLTPAAPLRGAVRGVSISGGIVVDPDPSAIYDAVLDRRVAPTFTRKLQVGVLSAVFADAGIQRIEVELTHGGRVALDRPAEPVPAVVQAAQTVELSPPVKDYLLSGTEDQGSVEYRVRALRQSGFDGWSPVIADDAPGDELLVTEYPAPNG